jgi:hypothetical protein
LNKSWYSKVFAEGATDVEYQEISRPSNSTYDFNIIDKANQQQEQNKQLEISRIQQQDNNQDVSKGLSLKELLLRRLEEKQGLVRNVKNTLTYNSTTDS